MRLFKEKEVIRRLVRIMDVPVPVIVELTAEGLSFHVKGNKKKITTTWFRAVEAGCTPLNVKSYVAGHPVKMLQAQAAKGKA